MCVWTSILPHVSMFSCFITRRHKFLLTLHGFCACLQAKVNRVARVPRVTRPVWVKTIDVLVWCHHIQSTGSAVFWLENVPKCVNSHNAPDLCICKSGWGNIREAPVRWMYPVSTTCHEHWMYEKSIGHHTAEPWSLCCLNVQVLPTWWQVHIKLWHLSLRQVMGYLQMEHQSNEVSMSTRAQFQLVGWKWIQEPVYTGLSHTCTVCLHHLLGGSFCVLFNAIHQCQVTFVVTWPTVSLI